MGGIERAKAESEKLGQSTFTKSLFRFMLTRCCNCERRIVCWARLFPDRAKVVTEYMDAFDCRGIPTFELDFSVKPGFDAGQMVRLIQYCAPCQYLKGCIRGVLGSGEFLGIETACGMDIDEHAATVRRCAGCALNLQCWDHRLKCMEFSWSGAAGVAARNMAGCAFLRSEEVKSNE